MWKKLKKVWYDYWHPHVHSPKDEIQIVTAELTEPNKPSRPVKLRVHVCFCETCGQTLNLEPMGVIEDKGYVNDEV